MTPSPPPLIVFASLLLLLSSMVGVQSRGLSDPPPPRPVVPLTWAGDVQSLSSPNARHESSAPGPFYFSEPQQAITFRLAFPNVAGDRGFDVNNVLYKDQAYLVNNGVCWKGVSAGAGASQGFSNWFGWLQAPSAKFGGYHTFNETRTTLWSLNITGVGEKRSSSSSSPFEESPLERGLFSLRRALQSFHSEDLNTADGPKNVTLHLYVTDTNPPFPYRLETHTIQEPVALQFSNQRLSDLEPVVVPTECDEKYLNYRCPAKDAGGGVKKDSEVNVMVRLHGEKQYPIAESNTGDFKGDVWFICAALATNATITDGSSLVSVFLVETTTQYGLYSYCNFYKCVGGSNITVGRESTSSFNGAGGQCAQNPIVGEWYSLPASAECEDDHTPITKNNSACQWRLKKRVKTVSVDCLIEKGLRETCKIDEGFPYAKSVELLERNTLTVGLDLCPDIPPRQ
eukprot:TRINITY_DN449_c1_g2_i1.p1 TRINITY_DN449_c1_g2~~TRINITY_DN449_c1_g2_i1.p1  ORF type:complete len:456 (+),score=93.91 TRINITY_DN449_c1_g2_i1:153-1520(+)